MSTLKEFIKTLRQLPGKEHELYVAEKQAISKAWHGSTLSDMRESVVKLWYLAMLGEDISIFSSLLLQQMSAPDLWSRRPAYSALADCFAGDSEIAVLATNILRKDLVSVQVFNISVGLACMVGVRSPLMATELAPLAGSLLKSHRPLIRRKAALTLLVLADNNPDLYQSIPALMEELFLDPDEGVYTAAIHVVLHILDSVEKRLLMPLLPKMFHLLNYTKSNWVRMKTVRVLSVMNQVDSRVGAKLLDVLIKIAEEDPAKSVLSEVVAALVRLLSLDRPEAREVVTRVVWEHLTSADANLISDGLNLLQLVCEHYNHTEAFIFSLFPDVEARLTTLLASADSTLRLQSVALLRQLCTLDRSTTFCQSLATLAIKEKSEALALELCDCLAANLPWRPAELLPVAGDLCRHSRKFPAEISTRLCDLLDTVDMNTSLERLGVLAMSLMDERITPAEGISDMLLTKAVMINTAVFHDARCDSIASGTIQYSRADCMRLLLDQTNRANPDDLQLLSALQLVSLFISDGQPLREAVEAKMANLTHLNIVLQSLSEARLKMTRPEQFTKAAPNLVTPVFARVSQPSIESENVLRPNKLKTVPWAPGADTSSCLSLVEMMS
ncbi:MAG: hypothetical protein KVP17_004132 [Porospora cf. gigantea B]|uniref:uncharacterized protein n=1 Tax=Porospora cf. gigantea B TaxID=2853592 RepID=UPI00357181B7|nr:MAG: hypothetical protein KVP17_004132 [Porospora cf. gigantea B]